MRAVAIGRRDADPATVAMWDPSVAKAYGDAVKAVRARRESQHPLKRMF